MKQTAVEWLFEEMSNIHSGAKVYVNANKKIVEQAKAIEKEQQEDFAIGFAIWCSKLKIDNWEKELLEIYKKEKGL